MDKIKDSSDFTSDYWDFTFHELAKYDVTANIDYITTITKRAKLNYLCHSQGCFQLIIGYTLNPEFFEAHVEKFGTMGAVIKISTVDKMFPKILKQFQILEWLEYFKIRNIMSFHQEHIKYFGYLCKKFLWICKYVISSIVENEATNQIEWGNLHNLYYYQPGGSSTKNLIHWMQVIGTETVRQFDYGINKNIEIYNSTEAPEYNLEILKKVSFDIFVTTSDMDPYCNKNDFRVMLDTFKKAKIYTKDVGNYNHLDYLWGKNAHLDIYGDILNFLNDI